MGLLVDCSRRKVAVEDSKCPSSLVPHHIYPNSPSDRVVFAKEMIIVPNWCENRLVVTGSKTTLQKFDRAFKGRYALFPPQAYEIRGLTVEEAYALALKEKQEWLKAKKRYCFNGLYPVPEEVLAVGYSPDTGGKGVLDGWNWCINNWGTKWDIYAEDEDIYFDNFGTVYTYGFDTAWGPPDKWIKKVAKDFKTLQFELLYFEPGMCFAGRIYLVKGKVLDNTEVSPTSDGTDDDYRKFVQDIFEIDPYDDE